MTGKNKFTALITGLPDRRPPMLLELLLERTGSENPELPALLGEDLPEEMANALKTEFEIMGVPVELLLSDSADSGELESLSLELDREIEQLKAESKPKTELPTVSLSFADESEVAVKPAAGPVQPEAPPPLLSLSLDMAEPEATQEEILAPEEESFALAPAEVEPPPEPEELPGQAEPDHSSEATPFATRSELVIPDEVELPDEEDEEEEPPRRMLSPLILLALLPVALIVMFLLTREPPADKKGPSVDIVQALLNEQDRMLKEDRLKAIDSGKVGGIKFVRDVRLTVSLATLSGHLTFSEAEGGELFLTDLRLGETAPPKLSPADLAAGRVPRPWIKRIELTKRQEPRTGESFRFDTFIYLEDDRGSERIRVPAELNCNGEFSECLFTLGESKPGSFDINRLSDGKFRVSISGVLVKSS